MCIRDSFYDIITNEKKRVSGVSNFDFISEKIELSNKWKGKVIVRTNEICGSARQPCGITDKKSSPPRVTGIR